MNSRVMRVAWYRFRGTFARQWSGYLSVILLVGVIGGLGMASIAGARRTQSSFPTFLASTDPSQLSFSINAHGPSANVNLTKQLAAVPGVSHVSALIGPDVFPLTSKGTPRLSFDENVAVVSSLDGLLFRQDRFTVVEGHALNTAKPDEVVVDSTAFRRLGVPVGGYFSVGLYTNQQTNSSSFGTAAVAPVFRARVRLMGVVVLNNQVIRDQADNTYGFLILSPALMRRAVAASRASAAPVLYGIQLMPGASVASVEEAAIKLVPPGFTYEFHAISHVVSEAQLSIKPESLALGAFGAIAMLVCLVIAAQAISRQLRRRFDDRRILRALGATTADTVLEDLLGCLGAIVLGAMLAFAVAVSMSPLTPIGPVRSVYPDPGVAVDWLVLGLGVAGLILILGTGAAVASFRESSRLLSGGHRLPRRSNVARGVESLGAPVAGTVGVHFALESEPVRSGVPVRSVLVGSAFAVALVVATVTFASGLSALVSRPALYGWNWNYMLNPSDDVPPQALKALDHDRDVEAWSGYTENNVQLDGQTVPMLIGGVRAKVSPPILSGHGLDASNQIVLGAETMALLGKHVGDTVIATYGTPKDAPVYVPPTKLLIVGTATFPAVGYSTFISDDTSMGTGALLSTGVEPPALQRALTSPDPNLNGPEVVVVRFRPGVSASAGRSNLRHIATLADHIFARDPHGGGNFVTVQGVLQPAQIVNYRSIGSTPVVLALGLAAGAITALGLTLVASVRRRRRDLALLKTFGFTQRQLAAAVAWQATVVAVVGAAIGIPVGIAVGRELWILFARSINAVPYPSVPVWWVVLIGVGSLLFANLVAIVPGRDAARTEVGLVLRAE